LQLKAYARFGQADRLSIKLRSLYTKISGQAKRLISCSHLFNELTSAVTFKEVSRAQVFDSCSLGRKKTTQPQSKEDARCSSSSQTLDKNEKCYRDPLESLKGKIHGI